MPSWRLSLKKARVKRKSSTTVNKLLSPQGASQSVSSTPKSNAVTEQETESIVSAIDGQVRSGTCPICNLSISHLLLLEQEVHVNQCLDVKLNDERLSRDRARRSSASASASDSDSRSTREATIWCPLCDEDLSAHTVASRLRHTDECMKRSLPPGPAHVPVVVDDSAALWSASGEGNATAGNLWQQKQGDGAKGDDDDDELAKTESESEDCFSEADVDGGGENQTKTGATADDCFATTDYDDNFDSQEEVTHAANDARKPPDTASSSSATTSASVSIPTTVVKKPSAFAVLMARGKRRGATSVASRRQSASSLQRGSAAVANSTPANAFEALARGAKLAEARKKQQAARNRLRRGMSWQQRNNQPRPPETCPFYKKMHGLAQTLVVDGFQWASDKLAKHYILTHFHSDHYGGLTRHFNAGMIYCTNITARLVVAMLGVNQKYVQGVALGERVHIPECQATLTFLEANHCPGAAVITIENHVNGEVLLHTGDFRFTRDMLQYPPLRPFVRTNRLPNLLAARGTSSDSAERPEPPACPSLAAVYLDTTYCDPRYLLPTQDDAVAAVVREVNAARIEGAGSRTLFLFGTYSIGKERVFMSVAQKCGIRVGVSAAKMRMIKTFNWPPETMQLLTTDCSSTRFHAVPMGHLNGKKAKEYLKQWPRYTRIVGFRPTGWAHGGSSASKAQGNKRFKPQTSAVPGMRVAGAGGGSGSDGAPLKKRRYGSACTIFSVAYSEHSSFSELQDFVKSVRAKRIIPTVNASSAQQARRLVALLKSPSYAL